MNSPHWNDPQLSDKAWERMRQSLDEAMPVQPKKRRILLLWVFPVLLSVAGIAGAVYLLFGQGAALRRLTPSPAPPAVVQSDYKESHPAPLQHIAPAILKEKNSSSSRQIPEKIVANTFSAASGNPPLKSPTRQEPDITENKTTTGSHQDGLSTTLVTAPPSSIQLLTPETIIPVAPATTLHPVVSRTEVLQSRYTLLDIAPVIHSTRHPWELILLSGVGYRFSNQQTGVNAGFQAGTKVSKRWWLVSGYTYDLRRSTVYSLSPLINSNFDPLKVNQMTSDLTKASGPYAVSTYSLDGQSAERYFAGDPIYQHTHHFYIGGRLQILPQLEWQTTLGAGLSNHPGTGMKGQPVVQWNNQLQWRFLPKGRVYAGWQQPMNYAFFENDVKKLPVGELSMGLQWSIFAP